MPEVVFAYLSSFTSDIGSPLEFLFFPLLTAIGAMMQGHTKIRLNKTWTEPSILWTIVAANKGERKTPTLKILTEAVRKVEASLQNGDGDGDGDGDDADVVRIHMSNSQFTFAKLHDQMVRNNGECLLMYDELSLFYQQLDNQSGIDKTVLLTLNGGNEWNRSTLTGGDCVLETTHFNYTGFMQPAIAIAMLSQGDVEGFNDRHIAVVCPKRQRASFDKLGSSDKDRDLSQVLGFVRKCHEEPAEYNLNEDSRDQFRSFFEEMEDKLDDEDTQDDPELAGIFSKAQGQLARLAMVLHVLYGTIEHLEGNTDYRNEHVIGSDTMKYAIALLRYCISQKLSLMPIGQRINDGLADVKQGVDDKFIKKFADSIKKFVSFGVEPITASKLSQKKLLPKNKTPDVDGGQVKAYPVCHVNNFMDRMISLGAAEKITKGKYKRTEYNDLPQSTKNKFQEIGLSQLSYSSINIHNENSVSSVDSQ